MLLEYFSHLHTWSANLRAQALSQEVAQRSFSPADDKQAVLMEMYTHTQLQQYKDSLTDSDDHFTANPLDAKAEDTIDRPSTGLSRLARVPMLCCALRFSIVVNADAVCSCKLPVMRVATARSSYQRCPSYGTKQASASNVCPCRFHFDHRMCIRNSGFVPASRKPDDVNSANHVLHCIWIQPMHVWGDHAPLVERSHSAEVPAGYRSAQKL